MSISRLTSLATLRLADNALSDAGLPWASLAALSGLTLLSLERNALTALPAALAGCSGLVKLSVAGNAITAVEEGALAGLGSLAELDLSDNALGALPESLGACGWGRWCRLNPGASLLSLYREGSCWCWFLGRHTPLG